MFETKPSHAPEPSPRVPTPIAEALQHLLYMRDRASEAVRSIEEMIAMIGYSALPAQAGIPCSSISPAPAGSVRPAFVSDLERGLDLLRIEEPRLEQEERRLADQLLALLSGLATLRDQYTRTAPLEEVIELDRVLHDRIGRLNSLWLKEKHINRRIALARARLSFRSIATLPQLASFLAQAATAGSARVQDACHRIAAALELEFDRAAPAAP